MLIKPIQTSVKPITERSFMQTLPQISMHTCLGICGRQFSVFAKSILDKYTKVLNYHFDYTSLIFLEQVAGEGEGQSKEINNTIVVTWKLLSFLLNHETKQNQFLYENPVLLRQMIQKVEHNLSIIKLKDQKIYQDMMKCYAVYEQQAEEVLTDRAKAKEETKFAITKAESGVTSRAEIIEYVEQQTKRYEEKQQTEALIEKEKTKTKQFLAPFIMSRSFFMNLNHLMNENKTIGYQQIWQQSVSQQLENHYLDLHMQQFVNEQDTMKKEEMVFNMFQEFGTEKVQEYLEKGEENLYEQFMQVMYTIAGSESASIVQKYHLEANGTRIKYVEDKNRDSKLVSADRTLETKEQTEILKKENFQTEEDAFSQRTLLLAEYKQKENAIMDILEQSGEVTRNIVLSKVEEYKDVFYKYMRSAVNQPDTEEESQESDNTEIFTDYELKVLLNEVEEKQTSTEKAFLEKKLQLIAMKEITESLLEEQTSLLEKERLQLIYDELKHVSFVNEYVKAEIENNREYVEQEAVAKADSLKLAKSVEVSGYQENASNLTQPERKEHKKIFIKLKNQIGQLQNENIKHVLVSKAEKKKDPAQEWADTKGMRIEFPVHDIKQIFETGTLPERKLFYLALEHTVDQMIIEKHNQTEEKNVLQNLIQAKQNMIQQTDAEKRVAGDWRFLMTKQRSNGILKALSDLQPETKEVLEQLVQNNVKEFYYEVNVKKEIQNIETKTGSRMEKHLKERSAEYTMENHRTEKTLFNVWEPLFEKQEIKQFLIEPVKEATVQIIKKNVVSAKKAGQETFISKQKKYYNMTRNMKFADVVHIFENGKLPEQKLMYVALKNTIEALEEKKLEKAERSKRTITKAHISKIKEGLQYDIGEMQKQVLQHGTKEMQKGMEQQKFVLTKEQNQSIVESLVPLRKVERVWLEEHLAEQVRNLLFHKETQMINSYIEKEITTKTKKKFENVISLGGNTKNVNKKLKIRHLYDKIRQKQFLGRNIHEKAIEEVNRDSFSYLHLETQEPETRHFYQIAKQLKKDVYLSTIENSIRTDLLTQKNKDFMQPPTEEIFVDKKYPTSQSVLSEQMRYHEESVKLILNHANDSKAAQGAEPQKTEVLQQEHMLRELEGNLLEYKVELQDKSERLEIIEQQLKNQEHTLQQLHESQTSFKRKDLKPAEARQFMKQLKEEVKMEQMRRGKR